MQALNKEIHDVNLNSNLDVSTNDVLFDKVMNLKIQMDGGFSVN